MLCQGFACPQHANRVAQPSELSSRSEHHHGRSIATLADLFFTIPNELQIEILCHLSFSDILTLRLTCRSFVRLITASQSPIVRYCITHSIPSHVLSIYPPPSPSNARLNYLLGLRYRLNICSSLAGLLADFFTAENFGCRSATRRQRFEPQRNRMERRMTPLLLVLFHFLEQYRAALSKNLLNPAELVQIADREGSQYLQRRLIDSYSPQNLLPTHEMYRLLLRSFLRKLRPPSYAGRLERSVRGWKKPPPTETDVVKVFLAGGLPEINKILQGRSYSERRRRTEDFVRMIDSWQSRNTFETTSTCFSTSSSDGYIHVNHFRRAIELRTHLTAGQGRALGEVLSRPHSSMFDIWFPSAEASLLAGSTVSTLDQAQSPNEFIDELAGDIWVKGIAEFDFNDLTLLTGRSYV